MGSTPELRCVRDLCCVCCVACVRSHARPYVAYVTCIALIYARLLRCVRCIVNETASNSARLADTDPRHFLTVQWISRNKVTAMQGLIKLNTAHIINKKAVLSQRWPRDARYISRSWTVAETWPFEINQDDVSHHLEFVRIENSAIRSAVPENPP